MSVYNLRLPTTHSSQEEIYLTAKHIRVVVITRDYDDTRPTDMLYRMI